jgi:hypothetical protein
MSRRFLPAALMLAACVIFTGPAVAAGTAIIGTWQIVEAVPAPWSPPEQRKALEAEGKRMLNTEVTFGKDSLSSKFKPFNCKRRVLYEDNTIAPDALFQGNLPEPNPTAEAIRLGFPKNDIPGVDVRCLKGMFTFHFRDSNTALININRVIYTLKRR